MLRRSFLLGLLTGLGLVSAAPPSAALEIYKWVSGDGATHYSEKRPPTEIGRLEILDVTPADLPAVSNSDYRSVLAVADDIQQARLARERLRLAQDALRFQQERAHRERLERDAPHTESSYFVPSYRLPYGYPYPHPRRPYQDRDTPGYFAFQPPATGRRPPSVPKRVYLNP